MSDRDDPAIERELLEYLLMGAESTDLLLDMARFEGEAGGMPRLQVTRIELEEVLEGLLQRGLVERWLEPFNGMEFVADASKRLPPGPAWWWRLTSSGRALAKPASGGP